MIFNDVTCLMGIFLGDMSNGDGPHRWKEKKNSDMCFASRGRSPTGPTAALRISPDQRRIVFLHVPPSSQKTEITARPWLTRSAGVAVGRGLADGEIWCPLGLAILVDPPLWSDDLPKFWGNGLVSLLMFFVSLGHGAVQWWTCILDWDNGIVQRQLIVSLFHDPLLYVFALWWQCSYIWAILLCLFFSYAIFCAFVHWLWYQLEHYLHLQFWAQIHYQWCLF
jgi:hypothetical protein